MVLRGAIPDVLLRLTMAALMVLWPALCCCGFEHLGCASAATGANSARSNDHGCHGDLPSESESGCHGNASGACHDTMPDGGCGCEKSMSTLANAETLAYSPSLPALDVAWLTAYEFVAVEAGAGRRRLRRVERPPPRVRTRLQVLRI